MLGVTLGAEATREQLVAAALHSADAEASAAACFADSPHDLQRVMRIADHFRDALVGHGIRPWPYGLAMEMSVCVGGGGSP